MYVSIYVFVYIYIYIIFICVPPKITLPVTDYMSPILEYSAPQGEQNFIERFSSSISFY